ncbi:hypothetical protein EDD21DRAFT_442597 [Dissophora ornata]|nr:hypothetical protein EDD21DRAFT_442597 [Dissophora ornata]
MVLPIPITIAAATSLVAGSVCISCTPVYADEKDRDDHRHDRIHSNLSHEYKARHFRDTDANKKHEPLVVAPDEKLMPGLAFVAVAALTGSFVVRQRGPLIKTLSPFAFASVAGCYFLPHTTRNLLGIDQTLYDRWYSKHHHSHDLHSSETQQQSHTTADTLRSELASKARDVWHTAEDKVDKMEHGIDRLEDKIDNKTQDAKNWWHKHHDKVDSKVMDQVKETKSWVGSKLSEADKTTDNVSAKTANTVKDAAKDMKEWVKDKTKVIDRKTGGIPNEADSWWKSQSNTIPNPLSRPEENASTWFRHRSEPEVTYTPQTDHKHSWLGTSESPDYWSNGEEISSADIRDIDYYSYPGSHMAPSLLRTSWWDRYAQPLPSLKDQEEKELLSKDIKQSTDFRAAVAVSAALLKAKMEKTTHDIQDKLAYKRATVEQTIKQMEARYAFERDSTERSVNEAKAKAKAWEKEQHIQAQKDAKAIEERVVQDKLAADKVVADARARADAWAHEQKDKVDQVAKDTKNRLLQEVATAEKNAKEAKDRAAAWAHEQKEKAALAAKAIQNRVLQEIDDAEKKANEVKAILESKIQTERIMAEKTVHELEQEMELKTAQAEKAARDAHAKLEAEIQAKKLAAEKAAQDMVARARAVEEKAAREFEMRFAREREETISAEKKRATESEAKEKADKLAFEKAQAEALAAKRRAEAAEYERKLHTDLAAKELEHMKEIGRAEAEARNIKARAEALFMEKKAASERAMKEMEERLSAERAEAAAREAKAHAEALALEKKMKESRAAQELEYGRSLKQAEAAARDARTHAEALLKEKMAVAEIASREMQQKLSLEKAEAEALEAKKLAESLLAEARRAAERASQSSSGWSWPWSPSKSTESNIHAERTSTMHTQEGYDTTGHLFEHVAEDIKQTKEDIEDGIEHLKETVLGARKKASDAGNNVRENIRETVRAKVETTAPERRGLFSSGANKISDIGLNVEAAARKAEAEVDIKMKAASKNMGDTSKKAYDNVINAATTDVSSSHHLVDHIRDDLRQTKEDIQYGMEHLKDTVFGAEDATSKAKDEGKKWWNNKTEKLDNEMNKAQTNIDKAATESKSWWSSKSREAENKASRLESELRAGLNKAGDNMRDMDRDLGEDLKARAAMDDDEYWFRAEQADQQHSQARRGSGRAM